LTLGYRKDNVLTVPTAKTSCGRELFCEKRLELQSQQSTHLQVIDKIF